MVKGDIKLVVYDFDGVMTDNRVFVNQDGIESVVCNRVRLQMNVDKELI